MARQRKCGGCGGKTEHDGYSSCFGESWICSKRCGHSGWSGTPTIAQCKKWGIEPSHYMYYKDGPKDADGKPMTFNEYNKANKLGLWKPKPETQIIEDDEMTELDRSGTPMRHNACGYVWLYNGKSKHYATCPQCLGKAKVANYQLSAKERDRLGI